MSIEPLESQGALAPDAAPSPSPAHAGAGSGLAGCSPPGEPSERADGRDVKGRFAPKNKAAERHGAITHVRRGGELPADLRAEHDRFRAQVIADLGGDLSEMETGLVDLLCSTKSIVNLLAADMQRHGMMTPRGRLRAPYQAWLKASARYEKIASKLGLKRRAKPSQTLDGYLARFDGAKERER